MSSPPTLRTVCVKKTSSLLVSGVWNECEENPFSSMPITVVQDLLSCVWETSLNRARTGNSRLLLTSGRLDHVAVPRAKYEGRYVTLFRILSRGCQNLRTLSVPELFYPWGTTDAAKRALQKLLRNCARLEHLHSCIHFDPEALSMCTNLKICSLHLGKEETEAFSRQITSELLRRLRSLEVLAPYHHHSCPEEDHVRRLAIAVLDNCPHLISLGFSESSAALKELHARDLGTLGTPRRFQMRMCYWVTEKKNTGSVCCNRIRVSSFSCPLVEILVIDVHQAGSLQHLKNLRSLTCLHVHFYGIAAQEFYSLLEEIGPQLRELAVFGCCSEPLILNVICGNCPNLSTLLLWGSMTADEGAEFCDNLLKLKRINATCCDRKSLLFLLSNCLRLERLCLFFCKVLEDGALHAILQKNPFAELEVAVIDGCSVSESVFRRFVQSSVKLSQCYLRSDSISSDGVERCVRDLNPNAVCIDLFHAATLPLIEFSFNAYPSYWL